MNFMYFLSITTFFKSIKYTLINHKNKLYININKCKRKFNFKINEKMQFLILIVVCSCFFVKADEGKSINCAIC